MVEPLATARGTDSKAEADWPLFNTLRDWRSARSKRDGVPPYVVCTNEHLAALIAARPQTLGQLGEVEGFGKAKLERYGADLLAVLARAQAERDGQATQTAPAAVDETQAGASETTEKPSDAVDRPQSQ